MLYNIEPDRSVTGGAWYSDQDFESEFVEVLNEQCHKYLQQKVREIFVSCLRVCVVNALWQQSHVSESLGPLAAKNAAYASSKEVWQYISQLGISKVTSWLTNLSVCLSASLSVCLSVSSLPLSLPAFNVSLSAFSLFICMLVCLSLRLLFCLSICMSECLSLWLLSVCPSIYLSVCQFCPCSLYDIFVY